MSLEELFLVSVSSGAAFSSLPPPNPMAGMGRDGWLAGEEGGGREAGKEGRRAGVGERSVLGREKDFDRNGVGVEL